LTDLELKYEQWAVPLSRPWALDDASTIMVGLRQELPAPGTVRARARAALEDGLVTQAGLDGRDLDIVAEVTRAFYDYYRAEREYWIHLEHVRIASEVVDLARASYRAGRGSQKDTLRAIVELSRLHTDVADIEQQRTSARLLLNTLMARAPDAPLGPPPELAPATGPLGAGELEGRLDTTRPELVSAAHTVKRSEANLAGARSAAYWPRFMVGADYWYQPTAIGPAPRHAYGAMLAINLPWLNPKHWDDLHEAEQTLAADRYALESARNVSRFQLRAAAARVKAAQESFAVLDRDLLPQAQQSFEASRAAYSAGQADALALLDALRSYLQVRLDREKALARVGASLADFARAAGQRRADTERNPK
jgi:outer membrane protein TolC